MTPSESPAVSNPTDGSASVSSSTHQRTLPKNDWRIRVCIVLGLLGVLSSTLGSLFLVLSHLKTVSLPGCGEGSGCSSLAEGRWGSIVGWPVSFLGLAWFSGLTVLWLLSFGRMSSAATWLIRAGFLASVGFLSLMWLEGEYCEYCVRVHAGNFLLLIVAEIARSLRSHSAPISARNPLAGMTITALAVTGLLAVLKGNVVAERQETAERETQATVAEVVASSRTTADVSAAHPIFTGRWRRGPEEAAIRIVVFGDYQCHDCEKLDRELETLLVGRSDIAVSFRHFPLCRDCNPTIKDPKFHDNACVAARVAEAAGESGQADGFWKMHQWLFAKAGQFTEQELHAALPELGISDVLQFTETLQHPDLEQRIRLDVEEASALGLDGTPLVYLNGVELPNADVEGTLTRAIEALTNQNLPARTAAADVPLGRVDRLVARWQEGEAVSFPDSLPGWSIGMADARVRMTLVYDYGNPYSPWLDELARTVAEQHPEVQLRLVLFPLSKSLNPRFDKWEKDFYGTSTETARLAQASSDLGGDAAFLSVHAWILQHQADFELENALEFAASLGLNSEQVREQMQSEAVTVALVQSIQAVEAVDIKWAGKLYINGRRVTALTPTRELLERMIALAGETPAP